MEIWLFLHNTTCHKPGPVVPQISLTHRPKDGRIITILVELAFLQAMSYRLSSKTSPPVSLLSHSNLVPHFLIPVVSFLATITVLLPYPPLLWGFKKNVWMTLGTPKGTAQRIPPLSEGFTCIPLRPHTSPTTTPRTLSLPRNTPPLTSRFPNLWL